MTDTGLAAGHAAPALEPRRVLRAMLPDGLLLLMTFICAGVWGTHYWYASWAGGREPSFYQEYFEPALMSACGKGFVLAARPVAGVNDFLSRKRDRFDCREIPPQMTYRPATFQAPWRYLMWAVAQAWKILGISWSGLGPLPGVLFGASIALTYGIFRLGMGRLFALGGAFIFAVAPIHLTEIPHVRDYAKAPFALACLLILGVMVTRTLRPKAALALSILYGAVVGLGYGFRSDLLIYLPPFFITLAAFMPDGMTKNLGQKAMSAVACVAAFVLAAWPILSVAARNGSCLWHFVLLGLTNTFTENLRLIPAPYDWGHKFADRWVYATVVSYAERQHPQMALIPYCSPAYDAAGLSYYARIVRTFPGDMLMRGLGSILGIIREAFWRPSPLPGFSPALYIWRDRLLRHLPGTGLLWISGAVLWAAGAELRLGLFLLFFLLYFAGYPAVQFHPRHQFHLEFIPWWAMGFVVYQAGHLFRKSAMSARGRPPIEWEQVRRAGVFVVAVTVVFTATMLGVRAIQDVLVRRMFDGYLAAPKQQLDYQQASGQLHQIPMPTGRVYPSAFLEVDLRTAACGPEPSVTIRYQPQPDAELSRTVVVPRGADPTSVTRVFAPVYEFFQGVEFSDERAGCVAGVYQIDDARLPILVNATLSLDWQREPLHQRFPLSLLGS